VVLLVKMMWEGDDGCWRVSGESRRRVTFRLQTQDDCSDDGGMDAGVDQRTQGNVTMVTQINMIYNLRLLMITDERQIGVHGLVKFLLSIKVDEGRQCW
jgi:hypothetical protein